MYTGFGVSVNKGNFELEVNGTGELSTDDADYLALDATGKLGSIEIVSENKYQPKIYLPVFIFGFDIAITYIHLTFETMNSYHAPLGCQEIFWLRN